MKHDRLRLVYMHVAGEKEEEKPTSLITGPQERERSENFCHCSCLEFLCYSNTMERVENKKKPDSSWRTM